MDLAPPRITVAHRVEWADTDASGHHHFTAVLRWVEEVERALHEQLRVADALSGRMPRVHVEVDYRGRAFFRDEVEVELAVDRVGTTSLAYSFIIRRNSEPVAEGSYVTVLCDSDGRPQRIPDEVRAKLSIQK